jgi:hypothetical protein
MATASGSPRAPLLGVRVPPPAAARRQSPARKPRLRCAALAAAALAALGALAAVSALALDAYYLSIVWEPLAAPALVGGRACEFSCALARPVEAENILETNQPTNHSLITDHCPK